MCVHLRLCLCTLITCTPLLCSPVTKLTGAPAPSGAAYEPDRLERQTVWEEKGLMKANFGSRLNTLKRAVGLMRRGNFYPMLLEFFADWEYTARGAHSFPAPRHQGPSAVRGGMSGGGATQLRTRPQGTTANRFGCMGGAIGVLLPALNTAGELHHRALAEGAMRTAGVQPAVDAGGNGGMTGRHGRRGNCREHSPWFHPCAAGARWVMAVASAVGATCPHLQSAC